MTKPSKSPEFDNENRETADRAIVVGSHKVSANATSRRAMFGRGTKAAIPATRRRAARNRRASRESVDGQGSAFFPLSVTSA
jgi:hypothetical protein